MSAPEAPLTPDQLDHVRQRLIEQVERAPLTPYEQYEVQIVKKAAALNMLRRWATAHAQRDRVILAAHAAGLSVHQIHRETGVARTTITRILAPDHTPPASR